MWQYLVSCLKIEGDKTRKNQEQLGIEKTVQAILPDKTTRQFESTPTLEKELVLGYCLTHGLGTLSTLDINHVENQENNHDNHDVFDCKYNEKNHEVKIPSNSSPKGNISRHAIFQLTAQFQEKALLYKDISIGHSAALATSKRILYFAEDLSRLNAWYKAVGLWADAKNDPMPPILMVSGKVDAELVNQAIKMGISTIITRLAPTNRALEFAKKSDLTLIGFARGTRLVVYSPLASSF